MNVFSFGLILIVVVLLLVNVAPVLTESTNNLDSEKPQIDDNAMNFMRMYPFIIVVGAVVILSFFWWRGGYD